MHQARATLTGTRDDPTLALVVTLSQDGDPGQVRDRLTTDGLPRLRQALDLDTVPVSMEFRFGSAADRTVR
ncbi:hypothetical protein [Amycolatopsis sp. cmx-4-61]|uniref:hypothetical protein n=1 Tax=Amycolatopsis sp. cmx-4-61 TaxID=2790937 RepID=UPI00397D9944